MKKLLSLIALFGVFATGCEELLPNEQKPVDKPTEQPTENQIFFTDVEGNYVVSADGGEVLVIIATNLEYSIVIQEEAQSWLSVAETRAEERIDKRTFIIARNDSFEERSTTAELIGTDGEVLQSITFVQSGQTKVFETDSEGNYRVVANGGEVMVAVTTNLEYNIVISEDAEEWLSVADTCALRVDTLTFIVAPNDTAVERTTTVKFVDDSNNILQTISFTQNVAGQSGTVCPNNEIWYTNDSTTKASAPNDENVFGANIVSNTYDIDKECWVIKFDGEVTTIGEGAFAECSSLTSITIPDSLTTIGDAAFQNCDSLTSVTIGDSVTTIGSYALYFCLSLTSVTIPDSVTTIGEGAFTSCISLQEFNGKFASDNGRSLIVDGTLNSFAPVGLSEYTIPDSVTTIGGWAFGNCRDLTSVTIPDSVTTIGVYAFINCSSLTSVYCRATTPPVGDYDMFYLNASDRKIYVPTESVEAYKSAKYWSDYASDIVGYDF